MAKKQYTQPVPSKIKTIDYADEMKTSYVDYAMSVIIQRALPNVYDGLKPVQRRIFYEMKKSGIMPDKPYKKSARIVGNTMGYWHPHGDSSIYGSLVHMSQGWVYSIPPIDGHGNMGSIEGDGAAAMRYTEARLSKITKETMLEDLNKDIVPFMPNFDETEEEPTVLPAKIPFLLINGSEGIAVGMACDIPSHNLREVIDAVCYMLTEKKPTLKDILNVIKGPDFATGGIISNKRDLEEIYATGKGKVRIRGKAEIVTDSKGKTQIIISEIPFTMIGGIDRFMTTVANLVRDKKATDITDISNLSGKEGIRIVVDIRKNGNPKKMLALLYKKAKLEDTFGFNMLAVKDKEPKVYPLMDYLQEFIDFQMILYRNKYESLLKKENKNREIKEGLVKAVDCIDLIIEILRGSKNKKDAKDCMVNGMVDNIAFKTAKSKKEAGKLSFTEDQANAILLMPLQNLIGLEMDALLADLKKCNRNILEYEGYLSSNVKMKNKIKTELISIRDRYGIDRKTSITDEDEIILEKEEIVEEEYIAVIDRFRYIKVIDSATYQRNMESIYSDYSYVIPIKNTDKLQIFVNSGRLFQIKVMQIPLGKYKDKGVPLENLCDMTTKEDIIMMAPAEIIAKNKLFFCNSLGMIKIVDGSEFMGTTRSLVATKLPCNTTLLHVQMIDETTTEAVLCTNTGYNIRFRTEEASEMKKTSIGVRGIKLKENDTVKNCFLGNSKSCFILDGTEIPFSKIKLSKRDGIGTKSRF